MWKRPAPWVVPSLVALLLSAAEAGDVGEAVSFPRAGGLSFVVSGGERTGEVLFDSGVSAAIAEPWDTMLFQGVSPDPAVRFEASRQDFAGDWTPWREASIKRHDGGRFWGRVGFNEAPGSVRVRAVAAGLVRTHAVSLFGVDVFAASSTEPSGAGARAQAPVGGPPAIVERADWGAQPPKKPYELEEPRRLTLHHTSGAQPATLADSIKEVLFIQDFHQNGRGWNDIAYHFMIDGAGNVFRGRPLGARGAHSLRANDNNVGVALLGSHHAPERHVFGAAKRAAFVRLGRWLAEAGVPASTLKGHRDYRTTTECPGDLVYPELQALKREMEARAPSVPAWVHAGPAWDGPLRER